MVSRGHAQMNRRATWRPRAPHWGPRVAWNCHEIRGPDWRELHRNESDIHTALIYWKPLFIGNNQYLMLLGINAGRW